MKKRSSGTKGDPKTSSSRSAFQKGEEFFQKQRLGSALGEFEKAVRTCREGQDEPGLAQALFKYARTIELMGEYPKARETYQEALKHYLQLGDKAGVARTKGLLGNVAWAVGDYSDSGRLLLEALYLFEQLGDKKEQAWARDLIGNLKLSMRDDQEAEKAYLASIRLMEEDGAGKPARAWDFYHLAAVALHRRNLPQAQTYFTEALRLFQRDKDILGQVSTHIHLGEMACDQKDLPGAQAHLREAVDQVMPTGCRPLLMDALTGVAQLLKAQGEERKAIGILMVALSNPTCRQQTKDRMVSMVIQLETRFTAEEVKGGFRWAKEITLEQMAGSWVSSLAEKNKKP